jgi:hypothetical protein
MKDALMNMLRNLRLSGLAETLEMRLQEASGNRLTHAEFLELILQDELLVRGQRPLRPAREGCRLPGTQKPGRLRLEFQSLDQEKRDV